jgi:hypothetical protein
MPGESIQGDLFQFHEAPTIQVAGTGSEGVFLGWCAFLADRTQKQDRKGAKINAKEWVRKKMICHDKCLLSRAKIALWLIAYFLIGIAGQLPRDGLRKPHRTINFTFSQGPYRDGEKNRHDR